MTPCSWVAEAHAIREAAPPHKRQQEAIIMGTNMARTALATAIPSVIVFFL